MMNFKSVLFLIFIVGYVTSCDDFCPEDCLAEGCLDSYCDAGLGCVCLCDYYDDPLALDAVKRVKKDIIKRKLTTPKL
ncbi:unnamed protein product [Caenorhabditis nigoni]